MDDNDDRCCEEPPTGNDAHGSPNKLPPALLWLAEDNPPTPPDAIDLLPNAEDVVSPLPIDPKPFEEGEEPVVGIENLGTKGFAPGCLGHVTSSSCCRRSDS